MSELNNFHTFYIMADISYICSHGTTLKQYQEIIKSGFKLGPGRAGNGAYFWVKSALYVKLAKDWFTYKKSRGLYDEPNPECVIIFAEIRADENSCLDLEDLEIKDKIYELSVQHNINIKDTPKLFNRLVIEIERELGCSIKILTVRVAPPLPDYPITALGAPLCCVTRATDCIVIKEYKRCSEV